jgi:hypothetical protein
VADERNSRGIGFTVFLALILAAIVYFVYVGSKSPPTMANRCGDESGAYLMAQEYVKQKLKAPATATFPLRSDPLVMVTAISDCHFLVNGYVDAADIFGENLRSPYLVELGPVGAGNEWQAYHVMIDQ